jgi:hypothetical protein
LKFTIVIFIFLQTFLWGEVDISSSLVIQKNDNSFITKYEYGKMLYENPRGISCKVCHGNNAKGKSIVKFQHTKKNILYKCEVKTVDITHINKKDFLDKLNPQTKLKKIKFDKTQICDKLIYGNTMPKYFLTNEELNSLYYYIENVGINYE